MTNDSLDRRADALARDSYYEATASRPLADDPMLDGSHEADVCVIGAGFAGLSVALECRARGLSVIVVDAHRPVSSDAVIISTIIGRKTSAIL